MLKKNLTVLLVIFMLAVPMVMAGTVTRSFSPSPAIRGETVDVILTVVHVPGELSYAIDESYPTNWEVTNTGLGDDSVQDHLSWILVEGLAPGVVVEDTSYTYTLSVPADAFATETFSGTYMFEGDDSVTNIEGPTGLSISAPPADETCSDGIKNQDETDIDCGGSCPLACGNDEKCGVDNDCQSGNCVGTPEARDVAQGFCRPAEICYNGVDDDGDDLKDCADSGCDDLPCREDADYICQDGACVEAPADCVDPDVDDDPLHQPTTVTLGTKFKTDECLPDGRLKEYYCLVEDGEISIDSYSPTCPAGETCLNGACVVTGDHLAIFRDKITAILTGGTYNGVDYSGLDTPLKKISAIASALSTYFAAVSGS